MSVRSGQTIVKEFTLRNPSTGAAANGDSTPTGVVYVNGTADAATVTVANQATGRYKATVTLPTLAVGDLVELLITATVNAVTDTAPVWWDTKDVVLDSTGHAYADLRKSVGVDVANCDGTAQAGTSTTITLQAGSSSTDNLYRGRKVTLVGGTGQGQSRWVTAYVGSTLVATVYPAWTTTPDSTSQYVLESTADANVTHVGGTAQTARDLGASVLLSSGTGVGQVKLSNGYVAPNWGDVGNPASTVALSNTTVSTTQAVASAGSVTGSVAGDVAGRVLGGGSSTITGTGVRAVDSSGNAVAPAATALSSATWTNTRAGYLDNLSGGAVALASGVAVTSVGAGAITSTSFAAATGLRAVRSGTAQGGTSTTITLDASASATTDLYVPLEVYLTGGTGADQARAVTAYNGTTKVATVNSAWVTTPDNTTTFALRPQGLTPAVTGLTAADVWAHATRTLTSAAGLTVAGVSSGVTLDASALADVADAVLDELLSGHTTAGSAGKALADVLDDTGTSGVAVADKAGYSLAAGGVDLVLVESGVSPSPALTNDSASQLSAINLRQALAVVLSGVAAKLAGNTTDTVTTRPAAKPSGNTRITATVDADNNRTAVTLKVPD